MSKLEEYRAEEAQFQAWLANHGEEEALRTPLNEWHRAWRLGGIEGYLARAAEPDPVKEALLEACKEALDELRFAYQNYIQLDGAEVEPIPQLEEAIALAEKEA